MESNDTIEPVSLNEYISRLLARSLDAADRGDFSAAEKLRDLAQKAESERRKVESESFETAFREIATIDAAIDRQLSLHERAERLGLTKGIPK